MEKIIGLENVLHQPTGSLTVGSFDGLHLGHQRILQQMRKTEAPVTLLTFNPHPQSVARKDHQAPPLITSEEERDSLFRKIGVDRLIIARFDETFSEMSPEKFVVEVLLGKIGFSSLYVGPGHRFGKGRKGDVAQLQKLGEKYGFQVHIIEPVNRFNEMISSSRIRKLLAEGDALTAWRCLGRPFYYNGKVVPGDGRGRRMNFPTANIGSSEVGKIMPPAGVYATIAEFDGVRWPSVSHFGPRPTFKVAAPSVETHIIGFKGDLYGHFIQLGLIDRMRDIIAFTSAQSLLQQMAADMKNSIQRLAELGFGPRARLRIQRYGKIIA